MFRCGFVVLNLTCGFMFRCGFVDLNLTYSDFCVVFTYACESVVTFTKTLTERCMLAHGSLMKDPYDYIATF